MTPKCLVLLSNIIKSHILKADQKRQRFIRLKSLAEHKNVIHNVFYNIFFGVSFTGEITFEDLHEFSYWALRYSYDIPSAALSFWGFYEATVHGAVLGEVSFSIHELTSSYQYVNFGFDASRCDFVKKATIFWKYKAHQM